MLLKILGLYTQWNIAIVFGYEIVPLQCAKEPSSKEPSTSAKLLYAMMITILVSILTSSKVKGGKSMDCCLIFC